MPLAPRKVSAVVRVLTDHFQCQSSFSFMQMPMGVEILLINKYIICYTNYEEQSWAYLN